MGVRRGAVCSRINGGVLFEEEGRSLAAGDGGTKGAFFVVLPLLLGGKGVLGAVCSKSALPHACVQRGARARARRRRGSLTESDQNGKESKRECVFVCLSLETTAGRRPDRDESSAAQACAAQLDGVCLRLVPAVHGALGAGGAVVTSVTTI